MSTEKINKYVAKGKLNKLIAIADGKDADLAKAAIMAMAQIKKDESFNYLVVNLRNKNKELRLAAIEALGNIGFERGKSHLTHIADTETDQEIAAAARAAYIKLADAK
jgi:HEAT repeat protein